MRTLVGSFRDRFFVALQFEEFKRLWLANAGGQAAAWALIVARGWLIFEETGSSFWVGAATFAALAPQFFVPPIIGVLADRIDRRTILARTYSVNLGQGLLLTALALSGVLGVGLLVGLAFVNGVARSAQMPTSQALAASLVPRENLLNALSLNASTQHGSRLIGPGLVTPLLTIFGATSAFLLCSALYAWGLYHILSLKRREVAAQQRSGGFFATFVDGLNYVYMRPMLRFAIVLAVFHCALTMAFESLLPAFAHERLTLSPGGFGTLMMGVGAGAFVASVLVSGVQTSRARGNMLIAMGLLSGLGQVLLSLTATLWLATIAAALMGAAQASFMIMVQAMTQSLASDEYRGRVASINTFALGGSMALMNLLNGSLAVYFGAVPLLFGQGLVFVGIILVSLFFVTGRRIYGRAATPALELQRA